MIPTTDGIAQHLEGITRRVVEAVNDRNWNADSDPWIHFARHQIVPTWWEIWHDPAVYGGHDPTMNGGRIPGGIVKTSGHHLMDFERHLTILAPEFYCRIVEVKTTYINANDTIALVMMVLEQTGIPPGVTRSSVCELDFRRDTGGTWLCKELREIPGLVGFDGVSCGQLDVLAEVQATSSRAGT